MRGLHFGYEDRAESALHDTLGDDYMSRRLSVVSFVPWVDVVHDGTGVIEHQPIQRMAIVLEGERSAIEKYVREQWGASSSEVAS